MRFLSLLLLLALSLVTAWAQGDKPSPVQTKPKRSTKAYTGPQVTTAESPVVKLPPPPPGAEEGMAVFHGKQGDTEMTALHPSYPAGTRVKVTNLANGRSVVVTITNRANASGPVINVSRAAANELEFVRLGTAHVRVEPAK
jgi:rare lipoprotein A